MRRPMKLRRRMQMNRITMIRMMIKISEGAKVGFARTRYPKDIGA